MQFNKDNINTFYWAGFIAADGNVYEKYDNYYVFQISLDKKRLM